MTGLEAAMFVTEMMLLVGTGRPVSLIGPVATLR
jgi:hypothetical protein